MFAPFEFDVDTRIREIKIAWWGIGNVAITYKHEEWFVTFRVFWFRKQLKLENIHPPVKKIKQHKKRKAIKINIQNGLKSFIAVMRTFKVSACRLSLDTGDVILNAWLYPLNHFIGLRYCNINFQGENYFVLKARNNIGRILYAWFR
ncbi:MAG TPA: hypothetical protein PLP23_11270 [Panacibacter sp.]|nr:hypothetical protein [Panacibacter sp.]